MIRFLSVLLLLVAISSEAHPAQSFNQWKNAYAKRAARRGIPKAYVLKTLKGVQVDQRVLDMSRNQVLLDKDRDYKKFIDEWVGTSSKRIRRGKHMLRKYRTLLKRVEKRYGVKKEVIVSLWGTETLYGVITGNHDLIRALATLAYGSNRKNFFEIQLNAALRLLRDGHASRKTLRGSWAGATGQCQFMPSNFKLYAQDFDGDGKKDIWTNPADVFASIAYFLKKTGWKNGNTIGSLALNTRGKRIRLDRYYTKKEYRAMGFRKTDGSPLSGNWRGRKASEIPLKNSPVVLKGGNYESILAWNHSSLFAAFNIILIEGFRQ